MPLLPTMNMVGELHWVNRSDETCMQEEVDGEGWRVAVEDTSQWPRYAGNVMLACVGHYVEDF